VIDLPRALQPWKAELDVFPREVALSIAGWIPKLALAVGPFAPKSAPGDGPPDGFGGIIRRGPYERLLLSEWLLADEVPDEFLRRAAMKEHAFLEIARTKPHGAMRSVVLFDAGPTQLGAPRLVHLALLIVLFRRAHDANAEFSWGILQDPDGWLFDGVTQSSVLALLRARGPHETSDGDLDDWIERVGTTKAIDDLWLVGAPRLSEVCTARSRSFASIADVLDPGPRRVHATILRQRTQAKELELELPPERMSIRLLRDPFEVERPAPVPKVERTPGEPLAFVFSPGGRRLFVRSAAGVVGYGVPNSPRGTAGTPRTLLAMGDHVLAAGSQRRSFYLITTNGERITARAYSKQGRQQTEWHANDTTLPFPIWRPKERSKLGACLSTNAWGRTAAQRDRSSVGYLFLDELGRLFLFRTQPIPNLEIIASGVTGFSPDRSGGTIVAVNRESSLEDTADRRRYLGRLTAKMELDPATDEIGGEGSLTAHFGWSPWERRLTFGLVALERDPGHWNVSFSAALDRIVAPEHGRVFGVGLIKRMHWIPGLLVIEQDGRRISLVTKDSTERLHTSPHPIKRAIGCVGRPTFAYLDDQGDITVAAIEGGTTLLKVSSTTTDVIP
jgi:hypothetical protein